MAHPQQLQFIKTVSSNLTESYKNISILEIGSYDVNGSVRNFFPDSNYVGVDLTEGPGVDLVCSGDEVSHPDNTYDICISCECFEHNPNWVSTFRNMYRMTKNGGLVIMTCATTGRAEHGTTRTEPKHSPGTQSINWDYYKNLTSDDFIENFNISEMFKSHFFMVNIYSNDLYFIGYKTGKENNIFTASINQLKELSSKELEVLQNYISRTKKSEKLIPKPLRPLYRKFRSFISKEHKPSNIVDIFN